ncbi:MAG: hypothetical protein JSV84_13945 [Gemmatimonadota bacterium]|nr:MAG: hypothetical protein JSV84_13945 [Gemmatimonadota bacterium]
MNRVSDLAGTGYWFLWEIDVCRYQPKPDLIMDVIVRYLWVLTGFIMSAQSISTMTLGRQKRLEDL